MLAFTLYKFPHEVSLKKSIQGIFLTQYLNLGLLHYKRILYHLSHQGSPNLSWNSITSFPLLFPFFLLASTSFPFFSPLLTRLCSNGVVHFKNYASDCQKQWGKKSFIPFLVSLFLTPFLCIFPVDHCSLGPKWGWANASPYTPILTVFFTSGSWTHTPPHTDTQTHTYFFFLGLLSLRSLLMQNFRQFHEKGWNKIL